MLTQSFLDHLEYVLSDALPQLGYVESRGFWCDGIIPPDKEELNEYNEISCTAWTGKDSNLKYELVIQLGEKALAKYHQNQDLTDCIPETDVPKWLDIHTKEEWIHVILD